MLQILHVERSVFFQKIIQDIIRSSGMSYRSARSRVGALKQIRTMHVDLIISGVELEDGRVDDLLQDLDSSAFSELPVFVISSSDNPDERERLFHMGIVDYMHKQDIDALRLQRYLQSFSKSDELMDELSRYSIAILDDSQITRKMVRHILALNGVEGFAEFSNPHELLESDRKFEIYLIDLILPGISGDDVISRIRTLNPSAIIIALSSITNSRTISHVLLTGADDYITKPFDAMIFMARIKAGVRSRILMHALESRSRMLQELADFDGLTGIFNHRRIVQELENSLVTGDSCKGIVAVLFDLDNFKLINDSHGHLVGDECLRLFSRTVDSYLRAHGEVDSVLGRYGGEEFLLILRDIQADAITSFLDAVFAEIRSLRLSEPGVTIRASAGVAFCINGNSRDLLTRADSNLYKAKTMGKDRYILN